MNLYLVLLNSTHLAHRDIPEDIFLVWISYWSTVIHTVLYDQPYILGLGAEMSISVKATWRQ